jgi:hypothetical protein
MSTNKSNDRGRERWRRQLMRASQIGFLFFFVKGLAWLVIPIGIWIAR